MYSLEYFELRNEIECLQNFKSIIKEVSTLLIREGNLTLMPFLCFAHAIIKIHTQHPNTVHIYMF